LKEIETEVLSPLHQLVHAALFRWGVKLLKFSFPGSACRSRGFGAPIAMPFAVSFAINGSDAG